MEESLPPNMDSFCTRDLQFIVKFHTEFSGDQFRHLVHALCPSIYGHELVKVSFFIYSEEVNRLQCDTVTQNFCTSCQSLKILAVCRCLQGSQ